MFTHDVLIKSNPQAYFKHPVLNQVFLWFSLPSKTPSFKVHMVDNNKATFQFTQTTITHTLSTLTSCSLSLIPTCRDTRKTAIYRNRLTIHQYIGPTKTVVHFLTLTQKLASVTQPVGQQIFHRAPRLRLELQKQLWGTDGHRDTKTRPAACRARPRLDVQPTRTAQPSGSHFL